MDQLSYDGLFMVAAVAFLSPLVLGLFPRLPLPDSAFQIILGVIIGPAVLGWVEVDAAVSILAGLGLAFVLFLAGFEIDFDRLRGPIGRMAMVSFVFSVLLAFIVGFALFTAGLAETVVIVAVILVATALGLVVPVLRDAGQAKTDFGQLALAGSSVGEFGAVILLSLLFSTHPNTGTAAQIGLLVGIGIVAVLAVAVLTRFRRSQRIAGVFGMLQDTSAQIRIRAAVFLFLGFVALTDDLGQEAILGAFLAGAVLRLIDPDVDKTSPETILKLDGLGYGFLIPVFFVNSGLTFDLQALGDPSTLIKVPIFLVALLLVRGIPAVVYRKSVGGRRAVAAGLLQATSLTFIVAAAQIGRSLDQLSSGTAAALIAAGILSVIIFPPVALNLIGERGKEVASDLE